MFGLGRSKHQEIGAGELAELLRANAALVIDVREADEFADGHIPGAVNMPLSTFQPTKLPDPGGKRLVLTCLGGKRSAMALDKCGAVEAPACTDLADTHLAGGFNAWASAGLPVER